MLFYQFLIIFFKKIEYLKYIFYYLVHLFFKLIFKTSKILIRNVINSYIIMEY